MAPVDATALSNSGTAVAFNLPVQRAEEVDMAVVVVLKHVRLTRALQAIASVLESNTGSSTSGNDNSASSDPAFDNANSQ